MIVAAVAAVALAGALLAEHAARWLLRVRNEYRVWAPGFRAEFTLVPGFMRDQPPLVRIAANREGERGDEVPPDARRLYRVLAAGGSAVEGSALDQEETWPVRVQRILERPENLARLGASHVHVGNIGRSGVGAEALAFILGRVLPLREPLDAVVIMVGGSDAQLWLREGAPSTHRPAWGDVEDLRDYFAWQPTGPFGRRPRRTALAEVARRLRRVLLQPVERGQVGRSFVRRRAARAAASELRREVPDARVVVGTFDRYLREAVAQARRGARRVLVAEQPLLRKGEYDEEELASFWEGAVRGPGGVDTTAYYAPQVVVEVMARVQERGQAVAHELGVEYLPLGAAVEPSLDNFYDLMHLTARGAATVADAVAAALLRGPQATPSTRQD